MTGKSSEIILRLQGDVTSKFHVKKNLVSAGRALFCDLSR